MTTALSDAELRDLLDAVAAREHPYPSSRFNGRGIVICAGGRKYTACAWVNVNMLRRLGCKLPVELWAVDPSEITAEAIAHFGGLGCKWICGSEARKQHPARILRGWELKCYSIIHSAFAEVLLLDADNVAVVNPEFLFETPEYRRTGAIFWPDYGRLAPERAIWKLTGVGYRSEPEFESGQIVVNKQACWKALAVTMHLNEYSDYYYRHIHGDKDTFHFGWRKIGQEYAMPTRGIESLHGIMCQHDFDGRRIFQHRNSRKWTLDEVNPRTERFQFEQECLEYLEQWRLIVDGPLADSEPANALATKIANQRHYIYCRLGHDHRRMTLLADGKISEGSAALERRWRTTERAGIVYLQIIGDRGITCELVDDDIGLKGRWLLFEKMPIILVPT